MTDEQIEVSEELAALEQLAVDAEAQLKRMRGLVARGKMRTNEELLGTVVPLFVDTIQALVAWGRTQEQVTDEITDVLESFDEPAGEPQFAAEDLQVMFDAMLVAISNLEGVRALEGAPEELKQMAEQKLPEFSRVHALLKELLEDVEDEDEDGEDAAEDEGDDVESEEAEETAAGTEGDEA
jgi:hypothetical protein